MFDQLPPPAKWAMALGVVLLALLGIYLNTRSNDAQLPDTGVIFEGLVTYDGKPLPYAVIRLYPSEKPPRQGVIASQGTLERDGSTRIASAPPGKVRIAVNTAEIRGMLMGEFMAASQGAVRDGKKVEAPKIIDVPSRYFSPDTSGLEHTLTKGVNKITLELTSKSSKEG